jgi:outer membrane receptor protein involved in Fe transport
LWGAEIDVLYQMSDQFRVSGYYSYLDSKIGNFVSVIKGDPNPQTAPYTHIDLMTGLPTTSFYVLPKDQSGNELPQQAHHKGALTLTYTQPLNELGNLDLLTTWSYTGKRHADVANLPIYDLPAYRRWDIRATWTAVSEVWSATLYVQNILNEIGLVEFIPVSTNGPTNGASSGTLTDPRQIGLQLRWRPTL